MLSSKEENTKLFFKELNNNPCNIELLCSLSKKGIFLFDILYKYENIKYHEYVVDLSLENDQYFMIYNDRQYKRFIELMKLYKIKSKEKHFAIDLYFGLAIPNEFFISKLINDEDFLINLYGTDFTDSILYFLLKYNYISSSIFQMFKNDYYCFESTITYIIFIDMIYLKNEQYDLTKMNKFINSKVFFNYILGVGRNIEGLEFIINNIIDKIEDNYCYDEIRIGYKYPLEILKKYSNKLYKPNILYFKHPNKYIESVINNKYGDKGLKRIHTYLKYDGMISSINDLCQPFDIYKKPETYSNYKLLNDNIYKEKDCNHYKLYENSELWMGNKDLFNLNFNMKRYDFDDDDDDIYEYSYEMLLNLSDTFIEKYLNDIELLKILKDYNYIIDKYNNDNLLQSNYLYYISVKCCILGSLIYNDHNKFIIYILTQMINHYEHINMYYKPQENEIYFYNNGGRNDDWPFSLSKMIWETVWGITNKKSESIFWFDPNAPESDQY
ncbi:hypothetical protein BCR32DRAFT_305533 [Anaeromyces robustus]|uniref:Uncharacterized protein n=1 Tax=Anaeromyces robustus TaxID=1754192 RepID=A0A1Y1WAI4_9FUNG|nr:hypothetical protein BCR32DRAFT_305533 [Anaeromyces robustus]|eukprot:ORX70385.1 hypothetical protein BCR32DRAFT_305533 [Anaeromyces robustus]